MNQVFECDPKTGLHAIKPRKGGCAAFFTKPKPITSQASIFLKPIVGLSFGIPIAFGIYEWGDKTKYDANLVVMKEYDMQWAFLGSIVFSLMCVFINMYPMLHKERVMKGGNMRANMFIYRLAAEDPTESSAVVLHSDGDLGLYNRANRGLHHFLENGLHVVVAATFNALVFPFPTFVAFSVFCIGRSIY